MKQLFKDKRFMPEKLALVDKANEIIAKYQQAGYRLTLRQLYYQFVTQNVFPNSERSYKNLGSALSEARLAGLVDWDAIEDRVRVPKVPNEYRDVEDLVAAALYSYRLPRWAGQDHYVELWVEKDALAGVLQPIARDLHVTLMVNRGYSSQSAMYEAARRFKATEANVQCVLLYLGDHDPSGEDMVRDVSERLEMFRASVDVRKIALTMEQVEEYDPPPNPAKMSDSRADAYVEKHGNSSWEVDALPPDVLNRLVRGEIEGLLDRDKMDAIMEREEKDKAALAKAAKRINK